MEEHHIPQAVQIRNAHVHNLKNIDVDIPLHQIVGTRAKQSFYSFQ